MSQPSKETITQGFQELQSEIIAGLEALDGKSTFSTDAWERPGGGGGTARVILEGNVIEKGGVNFSAVHGALPQMMQQSLKTSSEAVFYATGVSIVLHPKSPMVPIIHMNVRYFEMEDGGSTTHWFGGGIDLTPHYIHPELAKQFHLRLKSTCDGFDKAFYPKFKTWADDYFYIPHRKETRGIGGIFYDHLSASEKHSKSELFDFGLAVGKTFVPAYSQQVAATKDLPFSEVQQSWQRLRRGRYVEFNLVNDRGTKSGLQTDGRTESILMSLPPLAGWEYSHEPKPGSAEAETQALLRKGIDWI